jgi:hypothetical protein
MSLFTRRGTDSLCRTHARCLLREWIIGVSALETTYQWDRAYFHDPQEHHS